MVEADETFPPKNYIDSFRILDIYYILTLLTFRYLNLFLSPEVRPFSGKQ